MRLLFFYYRTAGTLTSIEVTFCFQGAASQNITQEEIKEYIDALTYVEVAKRPNVLNRAEEYTGGFDLQSKDYHASAFWYAFWVAIVGALVMGFIWLA